MQLSDPVLEPVPAAPAVASVPSGAPPAPARPSLSVRLGRAGLAVGLFGLFGVLLSAQAIPCSFARLFHTPCPGCGSTRAVLALVHGDLHGVLHYNPFGPVMALLIGVLGLQSFVSVLLHGDFRDAGAGRAGLLVKRGVFVVVVLEVLLWGLRFCGAFGGPVPV